MGPKAAAALLVAVNAFAGEYAILTNGSSLHVDRHESNGAEVRVYVNGGFADLPATNVVRFEQEVQAPRPTAQRSANVPVEQLIADAAKRWGLPVAFLHSIVKAESGYQADAVSPKGAIGLMQLMPETAEEYGADPNIPEQNVDAGTHYLRVLMDRYQKHRNSLTRVIAAYNAGPGMVDRYHGVPPFRETRGYVVRVLGFLRRFEKERG